MKSKKLIIDGIDVSKCSSIDIDCGVVYCSEYGRNVYCESNNSCYYKQLQRKTAECEQKEKELLSNKKIINKLMKEVHKLKQECEKLKNQVNEDYNYYTTELKTLRDIISNKEKRNAALFLTSGHYRKVLDEVEEYCENEISITGDLLFRTTVSDILNIISKAKDGNYEKKD